jgi:hypothetical protein
MTRPKGSKNVAAISVMAPKEGEIKKALLEKGDIPITEPITIDLSGYQCVLLSIVDALYDKDGDAGTWKPIRDKIELL